MTQGTRGGWARRMIVGFGAALCVTVVGCNEIDKPKLGGTTKQPGPGLPGTPQLSGQPGTGNVRTGQPGAGMQPMGVGTPVGRNPGMGSPAGGNTNFGAGSGGNSFTPAVGPANNDYPPISPAAGMGCHRAGRSARRRLPRCPEFRRRRLEPLRS